MPKKKKRIKLISWNVNGLRAVIKKDFFESFNHLDADIFAIQETKIQENQLTDEMKNVKGYESCWAHATVKKVTVVLAFIRASNPYASIPSSVFPDLIRRGALLNWTLMILSFLMFTFPMVR